MTVLTEALAALARGAHSDPFSVLGPHREDGQWRVRAVAPGARDVELHDAAGNKLGDFECVHAEGVFEALTGEELRDYRLHITYADGESFTRDDPYRFGPLLGDMDLYLLGEGTHQRIYETLGAHPVNAGGIDGVRFAVWAPNARRVSVVGDFNGWDGRAHVMRLHPGPGIWELFIPDLAPGTLYKYELLDALGGLLPLKNDPMAHRFEGPPGNASIVYRSHYQWQDSDWMARRARGQQIDRPISIYEVHAGSWRRRPEQDNRRLSYRELADELVAYVTEMGFTHVEFMPLNEHPFDGSWGYQPIGLYAPTHRFGEPDEFRYLVDRCHAAGIGVIVDWVPAHFPRDQHGIGRFDGTALYEHDDPRQGTHADWGTLIFNYGRREVVNYLIGSALYWIDELHVDALRVDAVASMLYLDYSREEGEWIPNREGGNENLEAVAFLRRLNEVVHERGAETFAEESTAWPGVSRPTYSGGLGFTYKWNMGWMNDSLAYIAEDPINRRYHHDKMTFGLVYAFNENFVLPLSHDEVVHGKGSLLGKMPGDDWQQFANLRAYLAAMYGHPGKKLLFMGGEFAQRSEWNHDQSLDWHLLNSPAHSGIQKLLRELNHQYRELSALHALDFEASGFEWLNWQDADNSVLSWLRRDGAGALILCVINFTPVVREHYRLGVPLAGTWVETLNTDAKEYGGSGIGNQGRVESAAASCGGHPDSIELTLPPLAALYFRPKSQI